MSGCLLKLLANEDFVLSLVEHMQSLSKADHLTVITKLLIAKGLYFDILRAALRRYPPDSEFRSNNPLATLIGRYFILHGRDYLKAILKPAIKKLKKNKTSEASSPSDFTVAAELIMSVIKEPATLPESIRYCLYSAFSTVTKHVGGGMLSTAGTRNEAPSIVVGSLLFLRFITPCILETAQWSSKDWGLKNERINLAKAVQVTTNLLVSHSNRAEHKLFLSVEEFARLHSMHPLFERFATEVVQEPRNTKPQSMSPGWSTSLQQKRDVDSLLVYLHHHYTPLCEMLADRPEARKALDAVLQERETYVRLYDVPT